MQASIPRRGTGGVGWVLVLGCAGLGCLPPASSGDGDGGEEQTTSFDGSVPDGASDASTPVDAGSGDGGPDASPDAGTAGDGGATPGRAHEPAGFTRIAEADFTNEPGQVGGGGAQNQLAGTWWQSTDSDPNLALLTDATAPRSPASVLRCLFPTGLQDGHSPMFFIGWEDASLGQGAASPRYRELYGSVHMKIHGNGTSYENQSTGTKLFYVPYMNTNRLNHSTLILLGETGAGNLSTKSAFRLGWYVSEVNATTGADPGGGAIKHGQNINTQPLMTVGAWHEIEFYLKSNTVSDPPTADGSLKVWVDGTLVIDYGDMRYVSQANPRAFYQFRAAMVFGGDAGEVKTRDDLILWDHLYLSGAGRETD